MVKGRDTHVLDKSTSHVKTLGARVKTGRMFLTEDPQILSDNVKKFSRHGDLALRICEQLDKGVK